MKTTIVLTFSFREIQQNAVIFFYTELVKPKIFEGHLILLRTLIYLRDLSGIYKEEFVIFKMYAIPSQCLTLMGNN